MGGDILIISCNTAHVYFDDIQKIANLDSEYDGEYSLSLIKKHYHKLVKDKMKDEIENKLDALIDAILVRSDLNINETFDQTFYHQDDPDPTIVRISLLFTALS